MWIRFNIAVVECTPIMHINFVIILEMCNKGWDITCDRALGPSIRAIVWAKSTMLLMLKLAVIRENIVTA
jgi:hypothetical protein